MRSHGLHGGDGYGDSVSAVLDCLEGGPWLQGDAEKILYGDSLSGVALLTNPDGPWRTRHLRLRAFALRERVRDGSWKLRHVKGETLVADFLTKAITVRAAWQKFTSFVGMIDVAVKAVEPEGSEVKRLTKLLGVGLALGLTACLPSSVGRAVGLASLAVGLAKLYSDAVPPVDRANEHPKALKNDQEPVGQRAQDANQEPIGQRARDADKEPAGQRARGADQEPAGRRARGANQEPGGQSLDFSKQHCPEGCPLGVGQPSLRAMSVPGLRILAALWLRRGRMWSSRRGRLSSG